MSMVRYFLVLAVLGGSLLAADSVLGFIAASEPMSPHAVGRTVHLLFSLLTIIALLGVHSIVYTYFMATSRWAREVVRAYRLPESFNERARRNKRRGFRIAMLGMTVIAVAAWLGGAADTRGPAYALPHLLAVALALIVTLGTFVLEYQGMVEHARLLAELKNQADRMREERYGPAALEEAP